MMTDANGHTGKLHNIMTLKWRSCKQAFLCDCELLTNTCCVISYFERNSRT